ncbi:ADP-ribosylglycohydrolase family protein [Endozoicomonas sp. 8E]|uniref:ADP-ribosylglycohydrolase family protein n=1 Tax=Endozoicomonas sp. 8E TaxID=3035692 RepID=UPI0029392350|nr:ADP-ribosylglycohydrolase family protein [Endozoicomonas sp. 8E]WOG26639.1 ADP-ribosylglycohydrolase family protein [Endozoicomonas sp. 8E]
MTNLGRTDPECWYETVNLQFFIAQCIYFAVFFLLIMPAFAATPTNAELALLGTALGDCKGTVRYGYGAGRRELFTDDTHKAAAIYKFFLDYYRSSDHTKKQHQKKGKGAQIDTVRLARCQCFFAFPEEQRFHLKMEDSMDVVLSDYGAFHSRLLKTFFQGFRNGTLTTRDQVLDLSSQSFRTRSGKTEGSSGNGGCMGIATIVAILDHDPFISDEDFVSRVRQTVQVSHNHEQAMQAAVAIALAARVMIEDRDSRTANRDLAEITLQRIYRHVTEPEVLKCLRIIEQQILQNTHTRKLDHGEVMAELNILLPSSSGAERSRKKNGDTKLRGTWAPSSAAAVLYFLFTGDGSQNSLLHQVAKFTIDQDTIGAMLMALSALREGGFRRSEFGAGQELKLLQELLDNLPGWVAINPNAVDYLVDDDEDESEAVASNCACRSQSM